MLHKIAFLLLAYLLACSSVERNKMLTIHERMKAELVLKIAEQDTIRQEHDKIVEAHKELIDSTDPDFKLMEARHQLIIDKYNLMDRLHNQILKKHQIIENRHASMDPTDQTLIDDHTQMEEEYRTIEADHENMERDFHIMDQDHLRAIEKAMRKR